MSDGTREKLFIRDEMEECSDVKEWMESRKKGKDRWVSMIVDRTTGMRYKWKGEHKGFQEQVTISEKGGSFWYAKWGIYNILAAREGTDSGVRMRKMIEAMRAEESVKIGKGRGRLWIETDEGMEDVWGCEFTNMMINTNAETQEEVDKIMISTRDEREDEYYRK